MSNPRSRSKTNPQNTNRPAAAAKPAPVVEAASVVEDAAPVVEASVETVTAAIVPEKVVADAVEAASASVEAVMTAMETAVNDIAVNAAAQIGQVSGQIEQVVAEAKESLENAVKASQDAASQSVDQVAAGAKDQLQAAAKAQDAAFKSIEEATAGQKQRLDALNSAHCLFGKGTQDFSGAVMALIQDSIENSLQVSKQIIHAKTPQEAMEIYGRFFQQQMDRFVQESTRLSDLGLKLGEQACAPLHDCLNSQIGQIKPPFGLK